MAMRVRVSVVSACSVEMIPATEFVVSPKEQVLAVKERVSEALELPFSEVELLKAGTALRDAALVEECDLGDDVALILKVSATDAVLVRQLKDLISDRCLTVEEVRMLYVDSFGAPVDNALAALGHDGMKLGDFLSGQKVFQVADGHVKVGAAPAGGKVENEISVVKEEEKEEVPRGHGQLELSLRTRVAGGTSAVEEMANIRIPSGATVEQAKAYIAQSEMIPYPIQSLGLSGVGPLLNDGAALADCRVETGSTLDVQVEASEKDFAAQLVDLLQARGAMSAEEISIQYCYQHGVPVSRALRLLGIRCDLKRFVETRDALAVDRSGRVSLRHAM